MKNVMNQAIGIQIAPSLTGLGQFGRSLRNSRKPLTASTWARTYPMLLMYRIARLLEMNSTSSDVDDQVDGHRPPRHVVAVQHSQLLDRQAGPEIPNSARLPSAVDDDIDRIRLAIRQISKNVPSVCPAIVCSAVV